MQLAQKIKPLRIGAGMTQDQLASAANVDRKTIGNIERGSFTPQADVLRRVFRSLGVATEEDALSPETEQWLGIVGPLVDRLPLDRRGSVMSGIVVTLAEELKRTIDSPAVVAAQAAFADALGDLDATERAAFDRVAAGDLGSDVGGASDADDLDNVTYLGRADVEADLALKPAANTRTRKADREPYAE